MLRHVFKKFLNIFGLIISLFSQLISINLYASNLFPRITETQIDGGPKVMALGEFTGDSTMDGFVALSGRNTIQQLILEGNAFKEVGLEIPVGSSPSAIVAGDFNNDQKLDLIVANEGDNTFQTLIWSSVSNGLVGFTSTTTSSITPGAIEIMTGDFKEDNNLDFDISGDHISATFIGQGNGTFVGGNFFAGSAGNIFHTAVGDFNSDNNLDIADTGSATTTHVFEISPGDGNGNFSSIPPISGVGDIPWGIIAEDINQDGKEDILVANKGSNNVSVLLGNGKLTFNVQSPLSVCAGPTELVLNDFNNDQKLDLAVICETSGDLNVLIGDGAGNFWANGGFQTHLGSTPFAILTDDFNKDGHPDLLISVTGDNKLVTLLGNKEPSLTNPTFTNGAIQVTYTDNDGELPDSSTGGSITAEVDGVPALVTQVDAGDTNVMDGKLYQISGSTSAGTHGVKFTASDGTYTTVLSQNVMVPEGGGGGCGLVKDGTETKNGLTSTFFILTFGLLTLRVRKFGSQ